MSARVSTARARLSKRSPSDYRKHAAPGSSCRRRKKAAPRRRRAGKLRVTCSLPVPRARNRQRGVLAQSPVRFAGNAGVPHPVPLSPNKLRGAPGTAARRAGAKQARRRREPVGVSGKILTADDESQSFSGGVPGGIGGRSGFGVGAFGELGSRGGISGFGGCGVGCSGSGGFGLGSGIVGLRDMCDL